MKRILLALLLLLAFLALGAWLYWSNKKNDRGVLRLSGHIEATETDLGFKVPGKIAAIHFEEGQEVKAGEVVAELESQDLRRELEAAQARREAARANLAKLEAGYRPEEVRQAQAAAARAQADYNEKAKDFRRMQNLFERRTVPASTRDKAEAAYLMAKEYIERVVTEEERRHPELTDHRERWYRLTAKGLEVAQECVSDPALEV